MSKTQKIFQLLFTLLFTAACSNLNSTQQNTPSLPPPHDRVSIEPKSEEATEKTDTTENIESIDKEDEVQEPVAPEDIADLWQRIRLGFTLKHDHPGIQRDLNWFASNQEYLDRVVERAKPFLHFIVNEAEKRNMPLEIALLPVVESAFQTFAYSHGRAAGIWQFIPGTGRIYGLRQNWWYDGRRDVWASTHAALNYLSDLYNKFEDWELALAAYNSGSGTVKRAIRINLRRGRPTDFWSLRRNLPKETRGYVPKLLAISAIVADPQKHGIILQPITDKAYFTRVELDGQLDLALAAEMADLSVEEIYSLNPAYNRWATEPDHANALLLPLNVAEKFKTRLAALPAEKRIRWIRHRITKGQTIGQIARRYNTTTNVIRKVNKLRNNRIRQGRKLIVPVAMKSSDFYTHTAVQRKKRIQNTQRPGRHKQIHIVKDGETFWSLSQKYGVNMRRLAKWNAMAPRDKLAIGQKLVIWSKTNKKITSIDTSRMIKPPGMRSKRWITYRVRRGDSLSSIARKFRLSVNQIRRWNKSLVSRKYLRPGQRIRLFVDVTKQSYSKKGERIFS